MLLKNVDHQHLSPRQAAQLVINDGDQSLLAIAARLMREILVVRARMHGAAKHGANCLTLSFDETVALPKRREIDLVALDDALNALGALEKPQIYLMHQCCALKGLRMLPRENWMSTPSTGKSRNTAIRLRHAV